MKPTSIIFIILAAILIVVGVVMCVVGGFMANASDSNILCDRVDSEGNDITSYSLSEYELSQLDIDVQKADVNIIGQSTKSYIEFKNINTVTYDFTVSKSKLSVDTVNPFDISSIVKFRENGNGFSGLRHYLYLNKYNKKTSEINIYITPTQDISTITLKVEGGDITVKNMIGSAEYDLTAINGNVVFENSRTDSSLVVKTEEKGNFTYVDSSASSIDFVIENGNGKFTADRQYNFSCECESGKVYLDDENVGNSFDSAYPEIDKTELSENGEDEIVVPDTVRGKIISGDLVIDTAQ